MTFTKRLSPTKTHVRCGSPDCDWGTPMPGFSEGELDRCRNEFRAHRIKWHRLDPKDTERIAWFDLEVLTLTLTDNRTCAQFHLSRKSVYKARVLQTIIETLGAWDTLRCTITLQCAGWQIYDESWASFRGGSRRCDFRLGGGGDSGGSRNSSRGVRAEHAAIRQDRRRSAALAC